jgi:hypothetical protein
VTAAGGDRLAARLARDVPGLRAVLLFGSTLAPAVRRATSIPDLVAIVDDIGAAATAFCPGPIARRLATVLPPVTFALREADGPNTVAKLNVVSLAAARAALARPDDLSLAGRLAKKTRLLYARDARARDDTAALLAEATDVMVCATTLGLPRVVTLDEACRRCFALSYRAEPRPETGAQIAARYRAFAADYRASYGPRLAAAARMRGIDVVGASLVDRRPAAARRHDARALARLLLRSRARTLLRWSRQPFVYRGWLPYLAGKLRRAWATPRVSPATFGPEPRRRSLTGQTVGTARSRSLGHRRARCGSAPARPA